MTARVFAALRVAASDFLVARPATSRVAVVEADPRLYCLSRHRCGDVLGCGLLLAEFRCGLIGCAVRSPVYESLKDPLLVLVGATVALVPRPPVTPGPV